jgi:hypothetical protein
LRLFLSVDLVGSTAFKARLGDTTETGDSNPVWVTQIRHFYREFPVFLSSRFNKAISSLDNDVTYKDALPKTWKTIGDEILFCTRLHSLEHLAHCVASFLRALEDYGAYLDSNGKHLDVKGAGWIAAFPAPNVTVEVLGGSSEKPLKELFDEEFEVLADQRPAEYDFLGKEIDSGFRSAKNAASDRLTASIELAWLLAEAAHVEIFPARFSYHGRQILKGVISDRPYPIVTIDAERNMLRKEVRKRERAVSRDIDAEPMHLRDFLKSFMEDEKIDPPMLNRDASISEALDMPPNYLAFKERWEASAKEYEKRSAEEIASETAEDGTVQDLPSAIGDALDDTVSKIEPD